MTAIGTNIPRPFVRPCWLWDRWDMAWYLCIPTKAGVKRVGPFSVLAHSRIKDAALGR